MEENIDYLLIKKSGLFDEQWFREKYSIKKDIDPIIYFLENCEELELNPSPYFNTKFYLNENWDVKNAKMNPLVHYIKYGKNEFRLPTPYVFNPKYKQDYAIIFNSELFDEQWFREKYSIKKDIDPIIYFLENCEELELNPSPYFDVKKYLDYYPELKNSSSNPFAHFIKKYKFSEKHKVKIGILGCCLSRDVFTTKMNPNYKDFFEINTLGTRVSMISLMQTPMIINEDSLRLFPLNPSNNFKSSCMIDDKKKTFLKKLKTNQPDYLIIDNYLEVVFGIICFDKGIISYDDNLKYTEFYNELGEYTHFKIYDSPDKYFKIWSENCDKFFDYLNEYCPDLKIILNKIGPNDKFLKEDGTIYIEPTYTSHCEKIIPHLIKLDEYIEENFNVRVIEYDKVYYLDDTHMWGKGPVHFAKSYYQDFLHKLKKIVIEDYFTEFFYLSKTNLELIKYNNELIKKYNKLLEKNRISHKTINNLEKDVLNKDEDFFKQELSNFESELNNIKKIIQSIREYY